MILRQPVCLLCLVASVADEGLGNTLTHTGQLYTVTLAAHARRGLTKSSLLQIAQSNEAEDTSEENMKLNVKGKFSRLSIQQRLTCATIMDGVFFGSSVVAMTALTL